MEELKRIKLFAKCSDEALERLLESPCRRQEYPAGRRMLNAGDPCRALMVLVEGQATASTATTADNRWVTPFGL